MITRETVREEILNIGAHNVLCELPTGFGKSYIALCMLKKRFPKVDKELKILIVIPRLVLINNWKEEIDKWGMGEYLPNIEFVTYVSFGKKAGNWDFVIFDEAHHLSERCREYLKEFNIKYSILLSATMKYEIKEEIREILGSFYVHKISARKAMDDNILPDPRVYLIPLDLDNTKTSYEFTMNNFQRNAIVVSYADRFKYRNTSRKVIVRCTQKQYYDNITSTINYYQDRKYDQRCLLMFLRKSGERLKWLSDQKTSCVISILNSLMRERTLTFCNSIKQTEELGTYCINSKNNKKAMEYLERFNNNKIHHITACNMLDEGVNLTNCRIGVYAVLNNSDRMIKQKLGRLLRHKDPIIIIPYFRNTRDEELVAKMMENYNPELVKTINNIKEIKL